MLEVIQFYWDVMGDLLREIWGSFYIVPGVSYLYFYFAVCLIVMFIYVLKLKFEASIVNQKDFNYSEINNGRFGYKPKHVYQGKHVKKGWFK